MAKKSKKNHASRIKQAQKRAARRRQRKFNKASKGKYKRHNSNLNPVQLSLTTAAVDGYNNGKGLDASGVNVRLSDDLSAVILSGQDAEDVFVVPVDEAFYLGETILSTCRARHLMAGAAEAAGVKDLASELAPGGDA